MYTAPPTVQAQAVPTGIRRIFADDNPNIDIDGIDDARINVDVAILDTGIDFDHPDLNVVARTDCTSGSCVNNAGDDGPHDHTPLTVQIDPDILPANVAFHRGLLRRVT